jgi:hypothetical protein
MHLDISLMRYIEDVISQAVKDSGEIVIIGGYF